MNKIITLYHFLTAWYSYRNARWYRILCALGRRLWRHGYRGDPMRESIGPGGERLYAKL